MERLRESKLLSLLIVLVSAASQRAGSADAPPPGLGRPFEKAENRSMDALITSMLGGVDVASNMILADNGHILAELDMYLTEKQFLALYEPPKPKDMVKMGMMPAPLGTPMADDGNYFFDFAEDYKGSGVRTKRKATRDVLLRWTDAIFPYTFAKGHFDQQEEYMMRRSMTEWERYTCMNFRPASQGDPNVVRFQNGVGCNSQLGMVGGVQVLNLQAPGCRFKGLYLHEIGHALGLVHEHQLPDRDNYIEILYHNVAPHMRVWFNKYTSREVNQLGVPYEYSSVMHYGITAFARDGESQTIRAKDTEKEKTIGKVYLKELAYTDVMIVNRMYNCSSHCGNQERCGPNGHLDQNCNCICHDGSSDCDTTKTGIDRSCRNEYDSWSCYIWANQGECERNEYYMKQQCAKACGACGNQQEKEEDANGSCKDKFAKKKCSVWKARGDCVTNTRWMKVNCRETCDLCGDESSRPAVQCSNTHEDDFKCEEWALSGECQVNRVWMFNNCRKSCWLCDKDGVDGGDGGGDVDEDKLKCVNTHQTCEKWASSGECSNNPTWMIPNCRKACGKCDDDTCKNLYDDIQCEIWSQKLKCITDATWMGKHCAMSCRRGLCEGGDGKTTDRSRTTERPPSTTRSTRGPRTQQTTTRRTTTTTTTTGSTGPCANKHSSDTECDIWAKNDHCHINPNWMLKYCAKACDVCTDGGEGGVDSTTKGGIDTGSDRDCIDQHTSCPTWAEHGYCDSHPRYNLVNCKKSCNNCNGCRDAEFLCGVWAKADNCVRNPGYMLRHCQKSCNVCSK